MRIDAFGKQCPLPLMMAKKEIDAGRRELSVAVDNETAVGNLRKLSNRYNLDCKVEDIEGGFLVSFSEKSPEKVALDTSGQANASEQALKRDAESGKDEEDVSLDDEDFDSVISSLIANSTVQKTTLDDNSKDPEKNPSYNLNMILTPDSDDTDNVAFNPVFSQRTENEDGHDDANASSSFIALDFDGSDADEEEEFRSDYCVFIPRDHLGDGDRELGANLMKMALFTFAELENPPSALLLMNSGVKLSASFDRQVIDYLKALDALGVEILICGACADWYDLKDQIEVGEISNMFEILERMASYEKVITL